MTRDRRAKHDAPSANENTSTNFLSIPGEISNEIYRLALIEDNVVDIRLRKRWSSMSGWSSASSSEPFMKPSPWREPGILEVSKAIRQEASSIYYRSNTFELSLHLVHMDYAVQWLRYVIRLCGDRPFGRFSFYLLSGSWKDLHCIKPLTSLFMERDVLLRPATFRITRGAHLGGERMGLLEENAASLFHIPDPVIAKFRRVLEQAVQLGKRGRVEEWHEDWFEVEFADWLDERMDNEGADYRAKVKRAEKQTKQRRGKSIGVQTE